MNHDERTLIRSLKGSPASIVLALILARGAAVTQKDLITITGYSDKTISKGLDFLQSLELIAFHGRWNGYTLGPGVQQLEFWQDVGNSPTFSLTTTTRLIKEIHQLENAVVVKSNVEEHGNSPTFLLLCEAGIGPESAKMGELMKANLDFEYVEAHVNDMRRRQEAGEWYTPGKLITILLAGDPAPDEPDPPAWEDWITR